MRKNSTPSQKDILREYEQHRKEQEIKMMTRRQFLGVSANAATAAIVMPSLFSLVFNPKTAAAAGEFNKFITFDHGGGASWTTEIVVRRQDGSYLPSYNRLGKDDARTAANIGTEYGAPIWKTSILYQALSGVAGTVNGVSIPGASAAVRANLKVAVIANPTNQDDTSNNPTLATHQVARLISSMGNKTFIPTGLGTTRSASGGNSRTAEEIASYQPAVVTSLGSFQNLLTLKQGAMTNLSNRQVGAMAKLLSRLNTAQKARLEKMAMGDQLGVVAEGAGRDIADMASAPVAFDPRIDNRIAASFGLTATSGVAAESTVTASGVKMLLDGHTPHFVQSFGGYDYHDGTATTWKTKHTEAIYRIVATLNSFAAAGQSVMIHANTDGSVSYTPGTEVAAGDNNSNHTALLFVLAMNGAPQLQRFQLGHYTDGQVAAPTTTVAATATNEGHAVFANLAAFQSVSDLRRITPDAVLPDVFEGFNLFKA